MTQSQELQINEIEAKILQAENGKLYASTRQQEESDQRRIDSLKVQLKDLQRES